MNEDLHNHIEALKVYADRAVINKADLEVLQQKRAQLKEIRADIPKYEKEGLRLALKGARDEEEELLVAINKLTGDSEVGEVYEALLPIVVRLGRTCQRPLLKDLREAIRAYDSKTTSPQVFRDLIIKFLEGSCGSASLSDVMHQIEQCLQGHFTVADLDLPPGKKRCRWEDNVRREIRKMKDESILTRRGGSTLILATHERGVSRSKQQGSQRLRWKRASRGDWFDLELTNPQAVDLTRCGQLLEAVQTADGGNPPRFNSVASMEFQRWLSNLNTPLREQAYARLSNWFLTDKEDCRSSALAEAALELWNSLFCAIPDMRLTDPKSDHKILPERFDLWWSKQVDCQSRGITCSHPGSAAG